MRQRARDWAKRLPSPSTLYISSACYSENTNLILQELRESFDRSREAAKQSFWKLADDPFGIANAVRLYSENDCLSTLEMWKQFNKINNEKEKEKMDAKKCERCGKLYEMQDADPYMTVYFPGLSVSDYSKENFSESRIRKDNTRIISVNSRSGQVVDMCPECRAKLKNFFESGKDDPVDAAVREINNVIKSAEEN